ncbi:hypothetical protein [Actinomadura napierensis]|uniref:Uncharacterized protein n=1 Tax=Actinomadura napierensis TaxID=267854 RepID=A0ABP5JHD8_9ACTN
MSRRAPSRRRRVEPYGVDRQGGQIGAAARRDQKAFGAQRMRSVFEPDLEGRAVVVDPLGPGTGAR